MKRVQNGNVFTWTYDEKGVQPLDLDVSKLSEDVKQSAMYHGIAQKVGDAAALPKDDAGNSASDTLKRAAMAKVIEWLYAGEWNGEREVSGGYLMQALNELKPGRFADSKAFIKWADEGAKEHKCTRKVFVEKISTNPKVKAVIDKLIRAATKDVTIDTDKYLS